MTTSLQINEKRVSMAHTLVQPMQPDKTALPMLCYIISLHTCSVSCEAQERRISQTDLLAVMTWQLCDSSLFSFTNIIPSALSHKCSQVKCAHGKVQFTQAMGLMVHGYCSLRFVNQLLGYSA